MRKFRYTIFFFIVSSIYHVQVMAMDTYSKANIHTKLVIDSCMMPKLNKQVQVIKNHSIYLQVIISSSINSQKNSIINEFLVESVQSNDLKSCMLDGFNFLSCSDSSFTINQNICDGGRYYVQENLVFTYNQNGFYLTDYKRNITDRKAKTQDPKLTVYSTEKIGKLTFQELNRDLLNLITQ